MCELNVAFIDDGINEEIIISEKHTFYHYIFDNGVIIETKKTTKDPLSHGTLCAKMFIEFAPSCNIYDVNIPTTKNNNMNFNDINVALKWCTNNKIHLISMSLGVLSMSDELELKKCIEKLEKNGTILVATCSNTNKVTYPASLPNVMGVRYDRCNILKSGEYYYLDEPIDGIDIITSLPKEQPLNFFKEKYGIDVLLTNSFATPYIASKICFYLSRGMNLNSIKDEIKRNSKKIENNILYSYYEKCILNFQQPDLLDIPIIGVVSRNQEENPICEKLHKTFRNNGYLCGLLSDESDILNIKFLKKLAYKYDISINQLVTLIINSNVLDLLLISINDNELENMLSEKLIDVVLKPTEMPLLLKCENIINYSVCYDVEKVYNEILNVFNSK